MSLYVTISDVKYNITNEMLSAVFSRYGSVASIQLMAPTTEGGVVIVPAVVTMAAHGTAAKALEELNGRYLFQSCCRMTIQMLPGGGNGSAQTSQLTANAGYMTQQPHSQGTTTERNLSQQPTYASPYAMQAGSPAPHDMRFAPPGAFVNAPPQAGYSIVAMQQQAPYGAPHTHAMSHFASDRAVHYTNQYGYPTNAPQTAYEYSSSLSSRGRGFGDRGGSMMMMSRGGGFDYYRGGRGGVPMMHGARGSALIMGRGAGGSASAAGGPDQGRVWVAVMNVPDVALLPIFTLLEVYGNVCGIRKEETPSGKRHLAQFFCEHEGVLAARFLDGCPFNGSTLTVMALAQYVDTKGGFAAPTATPPSDVSVESYCFKNWQHRTKLSSHFSPSTKVAPSKSLFFAGLTPAISDDELKEHIRKIRGIDDIGELKRKSPSTAIAQFPTVEAAVGVLVTCHASKIKDCYLRVLFSAFNAAHVPSITLPSSTVTQIAAPPVTSVGNPESGGEEVATTS